MPDTNLTDTEIKDMVRARYGGIATGAIADCAAPVPPTDLAPAPASPPALAAPASSVAQSACCAPATAPGPALSPGLSPGPTSSEPSCCAPVAATPGSSCCGPSEIIVGGLVGALSDASCCAPTRAEQAAAKAQVMGYSAEELAAVPDGANLGLGCGNPQAIAAMQPGEVVVDLGSGAGFDCLLAARQVGPKGRVIGVDMTHEMLAKARANAKALGVAHVEFRLGEIEHLPIADQTADVILSNCVINLVPDKAQVFRETFRVLKPGGRLAISDVVNIAPLTPDLASDRGLICGCIAGAASQADIDAWLEEAGFHDIAISVKAESRDLVASWAPGRGIENFVAAAIIEARKPITG